MHTELSQRPSRRPSQRRGAFTMVELLVSMAISLVIVYALVEFMKQIGDTVTDGRAMIDLAQQLRGVRQRLDDDLRSLTVQTRPWADSGYFEYREGPTWDGDADGNGTNDFSRTAVNNPYDIEARGGNTLFGDWDDILAFTGHAGAEPYVGLSSIWGGTLQSQTAEIVWFTSFEDKDGDDEWDPNEPRFIYRRVLLIRPDLNDYGSYNSFAQASQDLIQKWHENDISMRVVQTGMAEWKLRPNSLADLSRRENRFAHQNQPGTFPHRWDFDPRFKSFYVFGNHPMLSTSLRLGEDVMLSRVLAFDIQVFDPTAQIVRQNSDPTGVAITSDSPNYSLNTSTHTEIGRGMYVDLGYRGYNQSPLSSYNRPYANTSVTSNGQLAYDPDSKSGFYNSGKVVERVWCTWSTSYETDGIDQNGGGADLANDGIDNDNQNGVDDVGERDTSPPYPVPIRGIRVTIRIYDPGTRQVRQGVVTAEFMPE